jgi:hypothetical protein
MTSKTRLTIEITPSTPSAAAPESPTAYHWFFKLCLEVDVHHELTPFCQSYDCCGFSECELVGEEGTGEDCECGCMSYWLPEGSASCTI